MPEPPEHEVLLPDPHLRRRALVLLCTGAAVGMLAIAATQSHLATLAEQAATEPEAALARMRVFVKWFAVLCSFSLLAFAVWLRSIARRTLAEDRLPPSTVRVLRPTPVVTGEEARLRATIMLMCSFILLLSAFALPLSLLSLIDALASGVR